MENGKLDGEAYKPFRFENGGYMQGIIGTFKVSAFQVCEQLERTPETTCSNPV